jgi:NADPH:quinone reductase-like Zn-dependent oxidoreductase
MIKTEAWVLYEGAQKGNPGDSVAGELRREEYTFPDITEWEVLAEPIYGCWEGNMSHAIERDPVDICRQRGEEKVVIGNAGVVRVLKTGSAVTSVEEGDLCLVFCNGVWDKLGYPKKILAYDAPGTVGLLTKQTKLHERNLIKIPPDTRHDLQQWAAFSLRYITAWANWKVAYGCLRLQLGEDANPSPFVWGWGGGVTLAELALAKFSNCRVAMISSEDERLELIRQTGITPIDRRQFSDLHFDQDRYQSDTAFKEAYQQSEEIFLSTVKEHTQGSGVSIFIDFIGLPVFRATLKALARPGIITTAGWKEGMNLSTVRAIECMKWHTHVHTHYARYDEGLEAVRFAEEKQWMPPLDGEIYGWDDIPGLAQAHVEGKVSSYFPVYQVNPL